MPRRRPVAEKPHVSDPVLQFLQMVWQLEHALERASKRMEDALGISGPQRFALRMIGVRPGITAGELAMVLHLHPSTVTGIVQRLEIRRLVKRTSNAKSYRDLRGRTIAVTEGTTNEAAIKAINVREGLDLKPVLFRDHDQSFAALAAGKVDAWAGDDALLYAQAAESGNARDFKVLSDYLSYDPYGIMYRKGDPAFDALVKRTFETLAEDRELARIYEQWFIRKLPSGKSLGIGMSPQLLSIFESMGQPTE